MNAQRTVQIIRPSSELSTEDQKIKAAAYCRVSTDSDDQENSFLAQVKYYSDYIGFAVCFGLFLAVVVTVSLLFADKLPHATQPEGITGGYLFSFNVECVDESGNLLKTQKFTGNGTLWSFEPPEVDGYTTTCASITRDDITNWRYPASHYVREANGSIRVVYSPIGS